MKGFKGFNQDMTCRGMKYEVGKTYECEGDIKICKKGLHFCTDPLDVFGYYPPLELVNGKLDVRKYAVVKAYGKIDKNEDDDTKHCATKLKIEQEIDYKDIISESIKYVKDHLDPDAKPAVVMKKAEDDNEDRKSVSSNTGDCSISSNSGYRSVSSNTGYRSVSSNSGHRSICSNSGHRGVSSNTGDWGVSSNTGYRSICSNTGNQSVSSNTGDLSVCSNTGDLSVSSNTGDWGVSSNTGYRSICSNTGDWAVSFNTGNRSVCSNTGYRSICSNTGTLSVSSNTGDLSVCSVTGKESVAVSLGAESKAKGMLGCWLVLAEWKQDENEEWHRVNVKSFLVDNVKVKEDTLYMLVDGELKEVEENND